jgi:penicillin V acylase-like amidase (Ntn superfamily)
MKPRTLAAAMALLAVLPASAGACTTFCLQGTDGPVFGRNYDVRFGDGLVMVNRRDEEKWSTTGVGGAKWIARYGSLTFNQYGRGSPSGGMNEKGLVVEVLDLPATTFPRPDSRPTVSLLEWIQFLLDTSANVEEAIAMSELVRIKTSAHCHFHIADSSGDTASIEYLDGSPVIHRGESLPIRVLANDTYMRSLMNYRDATRVRPTSFYDTSHSIDRFKRAARLVRLQEAERGENDITASFRILDAVAQKYLTRWQIVYDLKRLAIHYRTDANRELRRIAIGQFDYACAAAPVVLGIDEGRGEVAAAFEVRPEANLNLMLAIYRKPPVFARMPDAAIASEAKYVEGFKCVPNAG